MAAELQAAIDAGNLSAVKDLFSKHGSKICLEYTQWDTQRKESPVHRAINQDRTDIALYLLQQRKSQVATMIKHADFRGETPLHRCGWCGRTSVARKLIKLGAKVNATNALGLTPLHLAAEREKLDVVELLIRSRASVNAKSHQGNTPLHRAMTTGNEALIYLLILAGADPDIVNHKGLRAGGKNSTADLKAKANQEKNSHSKLMKSKSVKSTTKSRSKEKRRSKRESRETSEANGNGRYNVEEAKVTGMELSFYEIQPNQVIRGEKLGEGGFGTVYEGTVAGQHVALKQLTGSHARIHENFRKELDMMCELRHPNIVLLLGAVIQPDQLCLVMELCHGGSLTSLLRQRELTVSEVVSVGRQVALAMNWLHTKEPPILHLDLKPANILLSDLQNLHVKVSDFGLARPCKLDSRSVVGTRRFMAPEMMKKLPISEKADVYSFAILLWQIYARKKPFSNFKNIKTQLEKKEFADYIWAGNRPPIALDMPPLLANLLHRAWANDPNARPNFGEIIQWLDQVMLYDAFSDSSAQVFWSLAASESYDGLCSIRWKQLKATIANSLGENDPNISWLKELGLILCDPNSTQCELVKVERFSSLANSFAPFNPVPSFIQRIVNLINTCWPTYEDSNYSEPEAPIYIPFLERDSAIALLVGRPDGTFLIRNSCSNTIYNPFTVSHVTDSQIKHTKIYYDPSTQQFSMGKFTSAPKLALEFFISSMELRELFGLKYSTHSESNDN